MHAYAGNQSELLMQPMTKYRLCRLSPDDNLSSAWTTEVLRAGAHGVGFGGRFLSWLRGSGDRRRVLAPPPPPHCRLRPDVKKKKGGKKRKKKGEKKNRLAIWKKKEKDDGFYAQIYIKTK